MSISTNVIQRVSVNAQHCPAGLVIFVFFTNFNISSLNIGFPIHTSEPKRPKIITFWKQLGMLISIFLHKVELWLKLIVPIQTFFLLHIFSHRIDLQMVVIYFNTQWPRNIAQQCATEDPTGNYVQTDRFRTLSLIKVGGWVNSSFGEQCHSLFTSRTMLAKAMVFNNGRK